jgi:outer membrane protein OmpU
MKKILLSSAALVAFAGAAAADVSWTGAATFGYNDDLESGLYADVDIDVKMSQELNNGWTAAAKFGFELVDGDGSAGAASLTNGDFSADGNILISLTSDMGGVYLGDTAFAAETYWSGVTNMAEDSFSEADGETVLRGEVKYGNVTAGVSALVDNANVAAGAYDADTSVDSVVDGDPTNDADGTAVTASGDLVQLSFGAMADLGGFSVAVGYQEEWNGAVGDGGYVQATVDNGDLTLNEVFGVSVSTSFSGADLTLAYAKDNTDGDDSLGAEVAYPMGAVTLGAFYVAESAGDDRYGITAAYAEGDLSVKGWVHDGGDEDFGVNIAYGMGDWGVFVGGSDDDGAYIGGELDLGNGASFTVSFANDDDDASNDEIGPQEYLHGTTVAVSLSF